MATRKRGRAVSKLRPSQRAILEQAVAAISAGDMDALRTLIPTLKEEGVLDHAGAVVGTGPLLHHALAKGHTDLARLMLDAGADIEAPDFRKRTPLMNAICFGDDSLVKR